MKKRNGSAVRKTNDRPRLVPTAPQTPRQRCAQLVRNALGKSVEGIIEAGQILIEYKDKLAHGEFEAMARTDLGFKGDSGPQIARMLMRIARHPVLSNPKYFSVLPPNYSTLYKLATAFPGEQQLLDLINQGLIHRGLKGDEVDELEDRLIETGTDASLRYLFARISPLIYYAENHRDLAEVVDRLWVLFQSYATKRKHPDRLIKHPPPPLMRRTPTGLVPYTRGDDTGLGVQPAWTGKPNEWEFDGDECDELKAAARWLDEFADAWHQKLIDSGYKPFGAREPSPLPDSPAAADERQRLQHDREQRQQQDQLAEDDTDALGLGVAFDDDEDTRPRKKKREPEPRPQLQFVAPADDESEVRNAEDEIELLDDE